MRLLVALLALFTAPRLAGADEPSPADLAAVKRLLADPSPSARAAAVRRLAGSQEVPAVSLALEVLDDPHPYVRRAAAGVLGLLPAGPQRTRLVKEAARSKSEAVRRELCAAFAVWLDGEGRGALLAALDDRAPSVRVEAVRWLAEESETSVGIALRARLSDADPWVRAEALDALGAGAEADVAGRAPDFRSGLAGVDLAPLLSDLDARVRLAAVEAAVLRGGHAAVKALLRGFQDPSWSVRLTAARRAPEVRHRQVLEALVPVLTDVRARVVEAAGKALVSLSGLPFDPLPGPWSAWLQSEGATFDPARVDPPPAPPESRLPVGTRTVAGPRFLDLPVPSRHVAFVLDGSGSMAAVTQGGRTRWGEVSAELERALPALAGAVVNLCVFADDVSAAFPRAAPLDAARRAALLNFVRARAPRGHTALYDGIAWALSDPEIDSIVVLSDGAPSAGQWFTKTDFLAGLRRANRWRRARIDVLAVGLDQVAKRWRDALATLAEETGGVCVKR